jgi:ribose transport system permease protein
LTTRERALALGRWVSRHAIFLALAAECLVLSAFSDAFLTESNLTNVLHQNAFTAILAAGMSLTILTAGIDLSVGSVVALSGVVCADALAHGWGIAVGVLCGIGVGLGVGIANGLVITRAKIPPFIATLAMMLLARGAAYKYTNARTISGLPEAFGELSKGLSPLVAMIAVFGTTWLVLMRTAFGRHVFATGGNPAAAWLSGIRIERVLLKVYAISGLCAGLSGVLVASRLNAGYPKAGEFYELDAITAVVVGGTSLFGGRGSIWGTLAGAFFIGILNNGLNLFHVGLYDQMMVKGLVLLGAASLDRWHQADR